MLDKVTVHFRLTTAIPRSLASKKDTLRQIRNAIEHAEDHALAAPGSRSPYNWIDIISRGAVSYKGHSFNIVNHANQVLLDARAYLVRVADLFANTK
jgi:hypothetical protein